MSLEDFKCIVRLNSGNFRTFEPSEWILNLNSSNYRAPNIIFNETELERVFWKLRIENTLFNFCVGVDFSHILKDAQANSTSFYTNVNTWGYRGKIVLYEKPTKMEITGVKIAWAVQMIPFYRKNLNFLAFVNENCHFDATNGFSWPIWRSKIAKDFC